MIKWLLGWLRRFVGRCPLCGTATERTQAHATAGVYETHGYGWMCNNCGWWRTVWEDGTIQEHRL